MKKIYTAFAIGIVFITFFSCSSSRESIYKSDYPLQMEYGKSISTDLKVRIPEGWFYVEDNKNHTADLWLLRDDFGAAIAFNPIHIDGSTINEIHENEIDDLAEALSYSKTLRKAMHGTKFRGILADEYFEINGMLFAAYQYFDGSGLPARVIVFRYLNYFFEASASFRNTENAANSDFAQLFRLQNSVVSSLE